MPNPASHRWLRPLPLIPCKTSQPQVPPCANGRRNPQFAPAWRSAPPRDVKMLPLKGRARSAGGCSLRKHWEKSEQGTAESRYPGATQPTGNTQHSCWGHTDFYQEIQLLIQQFSFSPNSPPHSMQPQIRSHGCQRVPVFHLSLKSIYKPQPRLPFLNAQHGHQTKSLIQYIQWFSVHSSVHTLILYKAAELSHFNGEG